MTDKYGRELKAGDPVLIVKVNTGGVFFGMVSKSQEMLNGKPNGNMIKVVELEVSGTPRLWVVSSRVVRVEESMLATARLIGKRRIYSDEDK